MLYLTNVAAHEIFITRTDHLIVLQIALLSRAFPEIVQNVKFPMSFFSILTFT